MILVIRYTILGAALGMISGLLFGYWRGGYDAARIYGSSWALYGLLIGAILGLIIALFVPARIVFDYYRQVTYELATCAWCNGRGKNFLILRCRVCRGYGSVLVVISRRKCAWCGGTGRELAVFRCRVCDGTGWAYAHADEV
jgi:hypothetical protein